jgi:ABC-2 type transport system ATP-binding protein
MKVIECKALTKMYDGKEALQNITFSIEPNTITGLIGRNGAGKSTLLKLLAGNIRETSGEIRVFGEKPFNSLKVSANSIFLDDNMVFPMTLNLEEILKACALFYNNWDSGLAKRLFEYFSFHPKFRYQHLSKGRKSTFNMIVGLASRAPLTIFDEPTTGMDRAVRQDFYRALLIDYMDYPRTIILSSHLLDEIEDLLEEIILLKNGEKLLHMPVSDLKNYAVGLEGPNEAVQRIIQNKNVLYKRTVGIHQLYAVVENDLQHNEREELRKAGIVLSAVSAEDVCMYLTNPTKGGIDDVFDRSKIK